MTAQPLLRTSEQKVLLDKKKKGVSGSRCSNKSLPPLAPPFTSRSLLLCPPPFADSVQDELLQHKIVVVVVSLAGGVLHLPPLILECVIATVYVYA